MLRKAKVCALDQLLLERFGGKMGEFSNRLEFCAAPVLTGYTGEDESFAETGHNAGKNISL